MEELRVEEQWLEYVLEKLKSFNSQVKQQKFDLDADIKEFWRMYDPKDKGQNAEAEYKKLQLETLSSKTKLSTAALKKPYFSRVDFKENTDDNVISYYLGKLPLYDDASEKPLVVDWRAPVATLYYEGRLGEAAYECPEGFIDGEISLKRQYIIEDARLKEFFDIDVTANDDFLQTALGSSKDKRLRDIVSTIQAEQNRIIRADMYGPVIVQGAAGSGKTTIALHRIAYLLYNYEKRLSPHNVLVVAPNRYFLSYISEVLPDLGVENVRQTTFEDFAFDFIEKRLKLHEGWEKLALLLKNPDDAVTIRRISRIKSSLWYKKIIDKYLDHIVQKLVPDKDFTLCGHTLMGKGEIRRLYREEYAFLPISKRAAEVRKYMQSALKKRKPELLSDIENYYDREADRAKRRLPENSDERRIVLTKLYNDRDSEIETLMKRSSGLISEHMRPVKPKTAVEYYKDFLSDGDLFLKCSDGIIKPEDSESLREFSHNNIDQGYFETEDLAPLIYLKYAIDGAEGFDIRHIVIDEAQDMSLFQMFVLKMIMNTGSFTILGDLCQGIYAFKGVTSWKDVSEKVFNGHGRYMALERSYRTTVEIMDFATAAAEKLKLDVPKAVPVIRHGPPVDIRTCGSLKETAAVIDDMLKNYNDKGYRSAAVICKTADDCLSLSKQLKTKGIKLLTGKEKDYGGGYVVLPAYLSKGLEFDGVIIADANASQYTVNDMDIKLLYVAMTRALHELTILAEGELTEILDLRGS